MVQQSQTPHSDWKKRFRDTASFLALVGGTAISISNGWDKASYVFAGLLALAAAIYLVLQFRQARARGRRSWWAVVWLLVGLTAVGITLGSWMAWDLTRPGVSIPNIRINHDVALEMLLQDYIPVQSGSMRLSDAIGHFRSGQADVVQYVEARIDQGVTLPSVALEITTENLTDQKITIHEVRIDAIQACGLIDCFAYGELPELADPGYMVLCPWWSPADLLDKAAIPVTGSGELTIEDPSQQIAVYLSNNRNVEICRPSEFGRLAVGLYEIEVSVVYGTHRRIVTYEAMLVAVPDLVYSMLQVGQIWQERSGAVAVDHLTDCQRANATRARSILALAQQRVTDTWIMEWILPEYLRAAAVVDE
jgi:hypothetical protein